MAETVWGENGTLGYARQQLSAYGERIAGASWKDENILLKVAPEAFAVNDPSLDDAVIIQIKNGKGTILASNPRALLIGVYRLLTAVGCCFFRPGPDGEIVPKKELSEWNVESEQKASFRYRGVVIEGADSLEHVLDFLNWMPKAGYNMFFTQFRSISLFLKRYYLHWHNHYRTPVDLSDQTIQWMEHVISERIHYLGLLQHAVGHGWTNTSIGVEGCDWEKADVKLSVDTETLVARVHGQRALFEGIPSETNLCYGNPEARKRLVEEVLHYAQNNPQIDYIHFWLADGYHNFCECERCQRYTPSDWYVLLLNELDAALEQAGVATKIVFLNYFDLMWPPQKKQLNKSDRFIMMFAPITRYFGKSFGDAGPLRPVQPYVLNRSIIPRSMEENLWLLMQWKKVFSGDCFDFDYYLGRAHYGDPGYAKLSNTISRDIDQLKVLGMDGMLSCQELRAAFPTNLPSYLMAERLWNENRTTAEVTEEYYKAAFGGDWKAAKEYLEKISDCFDIDRWYNFYKVAPSSQWAQYAAHAEQLSYEFEKLMHEKQKESKFMAQELSWYYLQLHVQYVRLFARAIFFWENKELEQARKEWAKLIDFLAQNEHQTERVFDFFRLADLGTQMPWGRGTEM